MSQFVLALPDELLALLGSPEDVSAKVREVLVLDLLRDARISQGQAARMLGVSRWVVLDLMVRYGIPSGPQSAEELKRDVEAARRASRLV
ncbi:MAG: UPF0175 family protein [Thermomicrobiales bacterium]